jgi:hypothetical protein
MDEILKVKNVAFGRHHELDGHTIATDETEEYTTRHDGKSGQRSCQGVRAKVTRIPNPPEFIIQRQMGQEYRGQVSSSISIANLVK